MDNYKITVTPDALGMLNQYLSYILFVLRNEQAYEEVKKDYFETLDNLSNIAGSIAEPKEEKLLERGLKRIHFLRHRYIMLYKVDGDEAIVVYIFHETEDYLNKIL